ncbi:MAG: nitrous oxide reductase family maturation protein NosD [Longimicrobiales bacterium]|nr:nitrous oxide reductase family maturation protein NosD [Longimicrobiales bacterium]
MNARPSLPALLLTVAALAAPASAAPASAAPEPGLTAPESDRLRVGPGRAHSTLASALAAAAAHDTVVVEAGTYTEWGLVLDRPLTVLGRPGAVVDAEGQGTVFLVTADSVTLEGLTIRRTGLSFTDDRAGIKVDGARFCRILGNMLDDTFFGIYLANAGDCLVSGNVLEGRALRETDSGNGIHLWYSTRVELRENVVRGHRDGIYFEFVEDSRVDRNLSEDNVRYGLHFMFSDRCTYTHNRFLRNRAGVAVMYTSGVVMQGNDFVESSGGASFGLLLKEIRDSEITGNRFLDNSVALYLEGANRVRVSENDFVTNGWAVKVMANSDGSAFEGNNFVGNSFDVATNSRSTASTFRGNFWDRYAGYDRDRDGVGDVPFRPVRLFSLVVEQNRPALALQRSALVFLLDLAEAVLPVLTPANLSDPAPSLLPLPTPWRAS